MANPRITTGLIDRPTPTGENDAAQGGIVFLVGSAPQGPTEPVEITSGDQAFRLFGDSTLAAKVEAALLGASFGAQVNEDDVYGRVVALRTKTGSTASVTLQDEADETVFVISTKHASRVANSWSIERTGTGFRIYDPVEDEYTSFAVDFAGVSGTSSIRTPSQLAQAIRSAFDGKLIVELHRDEGQFEVSISDSDGLVYSDNSRTLLDFSSVSDLSTISTGAALTMLDSEPNLADSGSDIHNAIIAQDNADARFYAITAGAPTTIPAGNTEGTVPHLVKASLLGGGIGRSLLDLTTTGADASAKVDLATAATTSEAFYQVRSHRVGVLDYGITESDTDLGESIVLEFDASEGIFDGQTARLGESFSFLHDRLKQEGADPSHFKLEATSGASGRRTPLALSFDGPVAGAVEASLEVTSGMAKLLISKTDFEDVYGTSFDDSAVFVSYDSESFEIFERQSVDTLQNVAQLQYAAVDDTVHFNRELPHSVVVRGLRITQYRVGNELLINRSADGNELVISGHGQQPGEGGGEIGHMEVIFGASYTYEPGFPKEEGRRTFSGGSAGANAGVRSRVRALEQALGEYKDQDYFILVPTDLYADDAIESFDRVTGTRIKEPAGVLDVLERHQRNVDATGASGIVYTSVKPMRPSESTQRYSAAQKRQRFEELTQPSSSDDLRLASIIDGKNFRDMFIFDAPMVVRLRGDTQVIDAAPFAAGLRSVVPVDRALYQLELPSQISPLYRYDSSTIDMTGILAERRVNVWSARRGDNRLADERTAAGYVPDSRGRLKPSSFQSGIALIASKQFLQAAESELSNLLAPIPRGGIDVLRGTVQTILHGVANRIRGVERVDLDINRDIRINPISGNAVGMFIKTFLQVNGELRLIELQIGAFTSADVEENAGGNIPLAS